MSWNRLTQSQKADLMRIYLDNGISSLDQMRNHYNSLKDGGKLPFSKWKAKMSEKYPDIEFDSKRAGYDYETYYKNHYDAAWRQYNNLQHFPDTYKLPNHPTFSNESIYSRGPVMGGNWNNDDTFTPSVINRQSYPHIYDREGSFSEQRIYDRLPHQYAKGGKMEVPPDRETFIIEHYNKWLKLLQRNKINDAERFAVYLTKQDALESSYGTSNAAIKKNNFGGMQHRGRNISYSSIDDYMNAKLKMLQEKMPDSFKATNLRDWSSSLSNKHAGYIYAEDPNYSKKLMNMDRVDDILGVEYTERFNLPPVKIIAESPYKLTDYQKSIIHKYYTNPDGSYTEKGKQYAREMSYYNRTGQSSFMKDINRFSPTTMLHEGISSGRNFIQNTPGLEFLYDATSTALMFSPLAPFGVTMQGLDMIGGANDMLDNGITYENSTDVLGFLPIKVKGTKALGKIINPHTGKVSFSKTQIPKQLYYDVPVAANELLFNDLMLNSIKDRESEGD